MRGWLKFSDACAYLAMSERKVRELIQRDLPHVRLSSGMLRFSPDLLDAWMMRHAVNTGGPDAETRAAVDAVMERIG